MSKYPPLLLVAVLWSLPWAVQAQLPEYTLTLKQHLFYPERLVVPAGQKFKLIVHNQDSSPEEFDSFDLNREKVLFPERHTVIYIGPLTPGVYYYFGEFHPNQAKGLIQALPAGEEYVD